MQDHEGWRLDIWKAAVALSNRSGSNCSFVEFLTALLFICDQVKNTAEAVSQLRATRMQLDLREPDYGAFTALQDSDRATAENLGHALEQTAGIDDPHTSVIVALNWALYSQSASRLLHEWWQAKKTSQEEHRLKVEANLDKQQAALDDANKLQQMLEAGATAGPLGAGFTAKLPASPPLMWDVMTCGRQILKRRWQNVPEPMIDDALSAGDVLKNQIFFRSNTLMCAAYIPEAKTLEVYQMHQPKPGYGLLELVDIFEGVKKLPVWDRIVTQDFRINDNGMLTAAIEGGMDKDGFELPKLKSLSWKTPYIPFRLSSTRMEKVVEQALREHSIKGGCWNTIMYGKLPTTNLNQEGFRSLAACVAVSGLAVFFTSKVNKMAAWMEFDNVRLTDTRNLTLGHCVVTAKRGGRDTTASKVKFIAAQGSPLWKKVIMWGT